MVREDLIKFGLPPDKADEIAKYFDSAESILDAEDFEVAAIGDMSIEDVRKLKEFLSREKNGLARDFLKRWGKVLSEENVLQAYEEYDKLSKLYPNSPVIWQIKGDLLEKMGKRDEARKAYMRAKELYESRGEIPPSYLEEKVQGWEYHTRMKGNGVGLINGLGFMNGRTHSQINGFSNGFKNGIINGSGLVNGAGRIGGRRRKSIPPFFRFLVSIVIIIAIIYTPLLGMTFFEKTPAFSVDGNFEEWKNVPSYYSVRTAPPGVNITEVKFHVAKNGVYFFVKVQGEFFNNSSGIYLFFDIDFDSSTGYRVDGIGAEYMVEVYGWNHTIKGKTFYFFNSTDSDDFSKFQSIGSVAAIVSGGEMEGFIAHKFEQFRSIVISSNYAGAWDEATIPIYGKPETIMVVEGASKIIPLNTIAPLLKIRILPQGSSLRISDIYFKFNGTATPVEMDRIFLYLDDGDGVFDSGDSLISEEWNIKDMMTVHFSDLNVVIRNNSTLFLSVRCDKDYLVERSVVANVMEVNSSVPVVIESLVDGGAYIEREPDEVHIDGAFGDWKIKKNDAPGDVMDVVGNVKNDDPNIDLLEYASYEGSHLLYYLSVNGEILGGTDCPVKRMFTLPDSDGDRVPDRFDLYPYDFNNDGIPDNESVVIVNGEREPDVDGDGVVDYPYGPDMWLNTTIPDNFPQPYAGREVRKYIGPVPEKKLYGYDTIRIFINSDGNNRTGYSLPQYPLGADYMVMLSGRDGKVENASLFVYNNSRWVYRGGVVFYRGYHSIELDSGIFSRNAISYILISDWDLDRDWSDSPMLNFQTRANEVHKQLHLHYNGTSQTLFMDTKTGSTAYYVNVQAGEHVYWTMNPPFSEDFDISGYPRISLYLVPHAIHIWIWKFIPGLNVSLYTYNFTQDSMTLIGYDYNPDISSEGWYNFTVKNTTSIKKGEALVLVTESLGFSLGNRKTSIDIYFNSTDYDSLIDIPTDTYINVDWIRTYNSSSETNLFGSGETAYIRARVSDPFGSGDISEVRITITDPEENEIVQNESMSVISSEDEYSIYEYSLAVPDLPGEYRVNITAIESNGVLVTSSTVFFVRARMGVAIYPDTTEFGDPGDCVYFNISMLNIGNVGDGYYLFPMESTEHFPFVLYIDGSLAARDDDGDGEWNWINSTWKRNGSLYVYLDRGEGVDITVIKEVPDGSWGESDLLVLTAISEMNQSSNDSVRLRTNVPLLSVEKVLYLNSTDSLSLKHGDTERSVTINYGNSYSWSFERVYYDVNLTGYIIVNLYIDAQPSSYSGVAITARLYADTTEIGSDEIIGQSGARWYTFTIVPSVDTIPKDSKITLTVEVKGYRTSATVYYDSYEHPSNLTIPTTDHIEIRSLLLYNQSGESTVFHAGETMRVIARVTSPFGPDDIGMAYLNTTDSTGSSMLNSQPMSLTSQSGGDRIYEYDYSIPEDGLSGYWNVRVDVHDDPVISVNATQSFFIPWDVNVTPNHNITTNVSGEDRYFQFEHTIINTGWGANIYEIVVHPSLAVNVRLYIDGNLAAEDYDGDGVWDYVNPSYDFDGDGNPDTGIMLPGESMNITLEVEVPANFNGTETVRVEAYSFLSQSVSDDSVDEITAIPELENLVPVVMGFLAIALIKRKGRFTLF